MDWTLHIKGTVAGWSLQMERKSGTEVLASFTDGPLPRAMLLAAAQETVRLAVVDAIVVDADWQKVEALRFLCPAEGHADINPVHAAVLAAYQKVQDHMRFLDSELRFKGVPVKVEVE